MKRLLLPTLAFVVFLLVINANAQYEEGYSEEGLDDEKVEEMLENILDNVDSPAPSNFMGNLLYRTKYVNDWGGDYWDDFEANLVIKKSCGGKVNGTYQVYDDTFHDSYTYGQYIDAFITIYLDNEIPSEGVRRSFEHDVNETKSKYDVYQESENRLIAYSINIGDWEDKNAGFGEIDRHYEIYCLEYFSIEYYEVYVNVHITIDVDVSSIRVETEYEKNIVYEIDPESWIINELESIQLYSSFTDDLTNNVKNALQNLIKEEKGEEEQEEQPIGNLAIKLEYYFDAANGKPLTTNWPDYVVQCGGKKYYISCNMTVEHLATGKKEYIDVGFTSGEISMDKVFNVSLINSTGDGRFRITLDVFTSDTEYLDRVKDDSFLPNKAVIECNVEISSKGNIRKVTITKARNCWIKADDKWEVLWSKNGYNHKDGTNGFAIKVRSVLAWEERIKYYIYKFLQESNFYSNVKNSNKFDLTKIEKIPIYYLRTKTGYDPSLNVINMSNSPGNIYTYSSDEFDSLFHEFAHAIKEHAYHFADDDVDDYLGGGHGGTCSVSNIYFAFEEGHSEFFASLMVDYVKERGLIEEQFLAPTDYYDAPCHFGKEGDKIEGAVAGLLLNGLYLNYVKYKYKDNPQAKTYEIFARACELCHKYLKHYPYSIHDVIPFLVATEPEWSNELCYVDLVWNGGYQCKTSIHGNSYGGKTDGLYGYPLLIAVEPSWFTSVEVKVGNVPYTVEEPDYGASDVSDGMACCIFIEKNTGIEADFSQGDGVYMILYDLNGNPMEEILAMQYGWYDDAIIEFEKDGIKVVQGSVIVKSNSGKTYKAGDKIKITPHSEFVLSFDNETASLYVMNGSVGVDNGVSYEEVNKNKKAVVTEESIDVSNYKNNELKDIWNNFGDAMATLGIEKEKGKGGGGKQPGFEIVAIAVAIATIIWLKKRNR